MGTLRERVSTYLGLRGPQRDTKPKIRPCLFAGVVWGALMGVLMQCFLDTASQAGSSSTG
jgi:hypothetical protein